MYYFNFPERPSETAKEALVKALKRLDFVPGAIVTIKDASGQLIYECQRRGPYTLPYYRRWRGQSFTSWTRFPAWVSKAISQF